MARPIPEDTIRSTGKAELVKKTNGKYEIIFTPPVEALPRGYSDPEDYKVVMAQVDSLKNIITFYPFKVWGLHTMEQRYTTLKTITVNLSYAINYDGSINDIDTIFSDLPSVFIKDYNYGLGFLKEYRHIVSFLEILGVKDLFILRDTNNSFDKTSKILTILEKDFNALKRQMDTITARARKVASSTKTAIISEMLSAFLSRDPLHPKVVIDSRQIRNSITKESLLPLREVSKEKQNEAVDIVRANSSRLLKEQPHKLVKLRTDIELVTLEELIARFEEMLKKDIKEWQWQQLFEENPFILNMAFGVPIVKIHGHASVGGRKISGAGDKIADFLVKNAFSNNAAIVEIKTPGTKLVSSVYRGGVYRPSSEASGAVNQLLDQIYKFQKNIAGLKEETRNYEIETYSVVGVLVIGRSLVDVDERKSFELFRGNSKNIHIITFDELLEKLKQLKFFLAADEDDFIQEKDLPF